VNRARGRGTSPSSRFSRPAGSRASSSAICKLHGRLARTLEAAAGPGGTLNGTVPADRFEPGPRFGCPVTVDARLSSDAMSLTGTFTGRCTLDGSRDVSLQGRFEASKQPNPYPSPF